MPPKRSSCPQASSPLPTLLQQDLADVLHANITVGTHLKPESAPVDKAVTDPINGIIVEPRHGTPGDAEEDHSSDPLKSGAVRPCDEPEQRPDEVLSRGGATDVGEPSHNADPADFEEFDGPIDDKGGDLKRYISRWKFASATFMLSADQGSSWTPSAPKPLKNNMISVNHFLVDCEN
ncbi:hypothetical protein E4U30_001181 [Claviceps sp. LM220 group G6]|nr:hypothetical protein E4U30_001181 [Claviceps sp. LM220 group G6]